MISSRPAKGFTTLTVTLLVIVFVTALSLMSGKMLVSEQRLAANEMRYREAMSNAEAGVDAAMARVASDSSWRTTVSSAGSIVYSASFDADTDIPVGSETLAAVNIVSTGNSADGQGSAIVRQQAVITPVLAAIPDAPLTLAGGMGVGGTFTVVANPNGGGPGVPLSIWSDTAVDMTTSTGQTCGQQEWSMGTCSTSAYSESGNKQSDILDSGPFPSDLLNYIFGVPDTAAGMAILEGRAEGILSGCSSLGPTSTGFYIIDGDCSFNTDVGTQASPVVLLVRNGDLTITGGNGVYGLVFSYDSNPATSPDFDLMMTGSAAVHGALVSNHEVGVAAGTYKAIFDATALQNIRKDPNFNPVSRIAGSWRDW